MATMYATTKEMTNGTFAYYFDDGETHGAVDGFTSHEEAAKALFAKYPHAELGNQAAFNNMYNELRNKRILASYAAEKAAKIEAPAAAPGQAPEAQPEWTPAVGQHVNIIDGLYSGFDGMIAGLQWLTASVKIDDMVRSIPFKQLEPKHLDAQPSQPAASEVETLRAALHRIEELAAWAWTELPERMEDNYGQIMNIAMEALGH